jgi:15,16-dihydrobiliverdin:ferredoxin oxidoreductase
MYIDNSDFYKEPSIVLSSRQHVPFTPQETVATISSQYADTRQQRQRWNDRHSKIIVPTNDVSTPTHGMPWENSISEQYNIDNNARGRTGLFFMKFYEWQISFMKQQLTNLKPIPIVSKQGQNDMSYVQNKNATMRMHTSAFTCDEYKYIRCTTVDGGNQLQVFTSLFYPRNTVLPVLGIDLLQFNHGKKTLCIVDFQPVAIPSVSSVPDNTGTTFTTTPNHEYYESKLKQIRDQYPSLQNEMTNRFYSSDDPYFSKQMLLGRIQHDSKTNTIDETNAATYKMVNSDLYPAYQQYVQTHVQLQKEALIEQSGQISYDVEECHAKYDTYSAERDPAHKLLANIFGQEFADDYVYDILFPLAARKI